MNEQLRRAAVKVLDKVQKPIGKYGGEITLRGFRKEVAGTENLEIAKITPPDRYGYYRPYMRFVGMEDYPF